LTFSLDTAESGKGYKKAPERDEGQLKRPFGVRRHTTGTWDRRFSIEVRCDDVPSGK
jgi:hypothetical protein